MTVPIEIIMPTKSWIEKYITWFEVSLTSLEYVETTFFITNANKPQFITSYFISL